MEDAERDQVVKALGVSAQSLREAADLLHQTARDTEELARALSSRPATAPGPLPPVELPPSEGHTIIRGPIPFRPRRTEPYRSDGRPLTFDRT